MHGILALGASHLHSRTGLELKDTVEKHRAMAMRGLLATTETKNQLARQSRLNAQLATAIALSFTGACMGDSVTGLMILFRGVHSLVLDLQRSGCASPFFLQEGRPATSEELVAEVRPRLKNLPPLPCASEAERAMESLNFIRSTCSFELKEWQFFLALKSIIENINDPGEAYTHYNQLWAIFIGMSPDEFAHFSDPKNVTGIVLQAHFLVIEVMLRPWLLTLRLADRIDDFKATETLASLPPLGDEHPQQLMKWPAQFICEAHARKQSGSYLH